MPTLPLPLQVNRSLQRIAGATAGQMSRLAADLSDVPWVRDAFWNAHESDVRCLGRFDIKGPGDAPWPSILIEVRRRPRHTGQTDRTALVAVYVNSSGEWESSIRESGKIPWDQYRGSPDGPVSVLNGDRPGRILEETSRRPEPSEASDQGTEHPGSGLAATTQAP